MKQLLASDVKGLDPVDERDRENEAVMETEVTLNGAKVKVGDLFKDIFDAREFLRKVSIIDSARGKKSDVEETLEDDTLEDPDLKDFTE